MVSRPARITHIHNVADTRLAFRAWLKPRAQRRAERETGRRKRGQAVDFRWNESFTVSGLSRGYFYPGFDAFMKGHESSSPFTRSILLLSKFAVFQATFLRVSYEAPRISPVSWGFQPRNRNQGSGAGDRSGGLALSLIPCRKNIVPLRLVRWRGKVATAELYGAAVGACFLDSLAPPWLWPPSELRCFRCVWAQGLVWLDGLGCRPSGEGLPSAPWPVTACT